MPPNAKQWASEIDDASRWWHTYPNMEYCSRAKALNTYQSYLSDVYAPVHRLARSASAERLSGWSRYPDQGAIQRTASVSSLSPSHNQPLDERVATRYVPLVKSYDIKRDQWRQELNFTNKHQRRSYTAPMYLPILKSNSARDLEPYCSKKHDRTSRITRPAYSHTRWQYPVLYENARWKGLDYMGPSMYTNYDRADDRRYMHTMFQVRRFEAPYDLRRFMGTFYNYNPKSVLVVM